MRAAECRPEVMGTSAYDSGCGHSEGNSAAPISERRTRTSEVRSGANLPNPLRAKEN